jgi:hypothetical protein
MSTMTAPAPKKVTHIEAYATLCAFLKKKPDAAGIVTSHIAAKHKIHTLPAFHLSDAVSDDDKLKTYVELALALSKNDTSKLQGQVAAGQAETPAAPPPPPAKVVTPQERLQHHVTGAIERGEAKPIVEIPAPQRTILNNPPPGGWTPEDQVNDPLEEKKRTAHRLLKYELRGFLGGPQLETIRDLMKGEEREFFYDKLIELAALIAKMPSTYETKDLSSDDKVVHLHYFTGNADWFIIEKDKGTPEDEDSEAQTQAFGYACIHEGEFGYISLPEITEAGAELDLHWTPKTMREILKGDEAPADEPPPAPVVEPPAPKVVVVDVPKPKAALRIDDYANRTAKVNSALDDCGIGSDITNRLAAQMANIGTEVEALRKMAVRQALHNLFVNVPTGIMTPEQATAEAAVRSAIAGYLARRCNYDTRAAFALCADLLEECNLHEEAAMLRQVAA